MSFLNENRDKPSASTTLSPAVAAETTRAWLSDRLDPEDRFAEDQVRWLMLDLAGQAFRETTQRGEGVGPYRERLDAAYEFLKAVWSILTPDRLKGWLRNGDPTADEAKREQAARRILWKRRDPLICYREGYESPNAVQFSSEDLAGEATRYVASSWMRHPFLDWVLVDALVTRELQFFGEEVKRVHLPGRRDMMGSHHRYFATKGNLQQMTGADLVGTAGAVFQYLLFVLALPIGIIGVLYLSGWSTTANWALAIYAAYMVFHLLFVGMRAVRGLWRISGGQPKKQPKAAELWAEMHQVWRVLGGPVVNPTVVREEMVRTTANGAVWDNMTWSILDSRIARDPAVWIVTKTGDHVGS